MNFAHPWFLLLLLALPLLTWLRRRGGRRPAFLYSSTQLVRGISGLTRSPATRYLPRLRQFAFLLLIIALARPQLGEGETRVTASGIDIIVAFDISTSMTAEDFQVQGQRVHRLEIARRVLRQFIEKRPNDRIGLVAFARRPYIASPLTLDHDFLLANLNRLTFASDDEDGTAIGSALTAAVNRLREVRSKSKIVILMTDGQNNAGKASPLTAADAARALQVRTYTIGVGTRGLAPVPYVDAYGYKRYVQRPVNIDEQTLTAIAERTGGNYYRADRTEALEAIYAEIDRLEKTEIEVKKFQRYDELYPWFALAGLALLLLEMLLAHTIWRILP
jgi:Ca-activated chloride channel family protein